jgi:hypothetical protein
MVMMVGEVDFGTLFAATVDYGGVQPSLSMPFPPFTLVYFLCFVCIMSILLMNLLVSYHKPATQKSYCVLGFGTRS